LYAWFEASPASHGNIQGHGIFKGFEGGNVTGKDILIPILIIAEGVFYKLLSSPFKQFFPFHMRCHYGTIARKGKPDGFIQTVHGIGCEHARTGSACGTGQFLNTIHFFITHRRIHCHDHGIHQVVGLISIPSRLHGSARYKNGGNVQSHGCHEHAGSNLVTIGYTKKRIYLMGIGHIFYAVSYKIPGRKGIEHTVVSHGNTIINGYGIKFRSKVTRLLNNSLHLLTNVMQVGMTGNKLGKGIGNTDNRFTELGFLHSIGPPEAPCSCHAPAHGTRMTAVSVLHLLLFRS